MDRFRTVNLSSECKLWEGNLSKYQSKAADALFIVGLDPNPWDWVTPSCGNVRCINPEHLIVRRSVQLQYPRNICIYCGRSAFTKDHLLPRDWTGEAQRHFVATVPACGTCNSILGRTLTWSITERRAIAHERLRKKFQKVLSQIDFTPEQVEEFGPGIRPDIIRGIENKKAVKEMLRFPEDPDYDIRALQKSGLEDPWAMGLILPDDFNLRDYVQKVA